MNSTKQNNFLNQNTIFGLLIGLSFIIVSYIYFKTGRNISLNQQLNNVITMLLIAGVFIGVRKYRQDSLNGVMSYGAALGACMYIIAIAAAIFGIYTYILYRNNPELLETYISAIEETFKEVYANSPLLENMLTMIRAYTTNGAIAFAEFFNKIFTGFIFSLLLAGILRRSAPRQ